VKPKYFLILFLLFTAITGCTPPPVETTPTAFTPVNTPQATLLSVTAETTVQPQGEEPQETCVSSSIERYQIDSELLRGPLYFSVYFPLCYDETRESGYPVLYALHGQKFNDAMWIDLGAAEIADRLILEGEIVPFLIVMPYEEFYYRGADVNNFPSALREEIIPWIEQTLNVCAEKECRAVGGISRGASWAMRIGLEQWDFYGAIGAHSLPTFRGDISNLPEWLEEIPFDEEPRIYLDTGRLDPEVKSVYRFENILSQKGFPHDWHLNEGRHNEAYWQENMAAYLRWYAQEW